MSFLELEQALKKNAILVLPNPKISVARDAQKKLNTVLVISRAQMFLSPHVKMVKISTTAQETHNIIQRLYKRNSTTAIVCDMEHLVMHLKVRLFPDQKNWAQNEIIYI